MSSYLTAFVICASLLLNRENAYAMQECFYAACEDYHLVIWHSPYRTTKVDAEEDLRNHNNKSHGGKERDLQYVFEASCTSKELSKLDKPRQPGSNCFIATAAYGSALAPMVDTLRTFRDRHLLPYPLGRLFIAAYYTTGPYLAVVIDNIEVLRHLARRALSPLVHIAASIDKLEYQ